MKTNLLKNSLVAGSVALTFFAASCSKDQPMTENPNIKKDGSDSITGVVNDFLSDYEDYLSEGASTTPTIEHEHAVWLLEAALNYTNSLDPESDDHYVDVASQSTAESNLDFTISSGQALVSEDDLFSFFSELLSNYNGAAPITDLTLIGKDGSELVIQIVDYDLVGDEPEGVDPIGSNEAYTAVAKGTCDPNVPSGPSNWITDPLNAADRIQDAIKPYYMQYPGTSLPSGWAVYGWYHSIEGHVVGEDVAMPGFKWISHTVHYNPVTNQFYGIKSSPSSSVVASNAWGGSETYTNSTPRETWECLGSTELIYWRDEAENMAENEASNMGGGTSVFRIWLQGKHDQNSGQSYHEIVWISGVYQTHGS